MKYLRVAGMVFLIGSGILVGLIAPNLPGCKDTKPSATDNKAIEDAFRQAWLKVNQERPLKSCEVTEARITEFGHGGTAIVTVAYSYENAGTVMLKKERFNFGTEWQIDGYDLEKLEPPAWREEREDAAIADIASIGAALRLFKGDCGRFPTSEEGLTALVEPPTNSSNWHGPYLKRGLPNDPWGKPYVYLCPGKHNLTGFDLSSPGPYWREVPDGYLSNWAKE